MTPPITDTADDDPIPPLQDPRHAPPIRHGEDLRRRWRSLMGPDGFGTDSLWLMWLDETGHQLPILMPIDDVDADFASDWLDSLITIMDDPYDLGADGVAVALSRPGPATVSDQDRRRARQLLAATRAARRSGALRPTMWPLQLATRNSVRTFGADDLL